MDCSYRSTCEHLDKLAVHGADSKSTRQGANLGVLDSCFNNDTDRKTTVLS